MRDVKTCRMIGEHDMRRIKPQQLEEGQKLGQDIFRENRLVYYKGSIITTQMASDLKEWRKSPITIDEPLTGLNYGDAKMPIEDQKNLSQLFYERLIHIGLEKRYGFALIEESIYLWLEELFLRMMSDHAVYTLIRKLESWNPYSFDHSIDVFVLGALLGKKLAVRDIDQFALGCLLHDAGKLQIPPYILEKKSKLTQTEYLLVQNHAVMGANLLSEMDFGNRIIKLARSHHERLNGTGYPDRLSGKMLDIDLQIISIVDVYSALTLPRAYREPMASPEALELILKDGNAFNQNVLFAFIEMLNIFPPQAEVRLSNGQTGTTIYQHNWKTNVPMIAIHDTGEVFRLPTNLSLVVKEMLGWNSLRIDQSIKKHWQSFLNSLIAGNRKKALASFDLLADGKRVEDIYIDIIERAVKEITSSPHSKEELNTARRMAFDIMDKKLVEFAPSYQTVNHQTVIVTAYDESQLLPSKILHDVLFVNGWKTYYLSLKTNEQKLKRIIEVNDATHVAFYVPTEEQSIVYNIVINGLLEAFPSLSVIIYGEAAHLIETRAGIKARSIRSLLDQLKTFEEVSA